ncbi:hypothetical protein BJ875DRAFT_175088 [Amylocarpus encephaloides]|uniref:Uncharacterized protein n=1 Tax=Amylocarpus encephaloides TaxID=45428 RepID=A0A9P7YQA3_9HELO|nr:hypothetical protein BJ875DRAFT_175088 [Amylocarpus encephaloides]
MIISPEVTPVVEIPTMDPIPASELSNSENIVEDADDEGPISSLDAMDDEVVPDRSVKLSDVSVQLPDVKASTYEIEDRELSEEESVDEGPEEEAFSRSYHTSIPDDFQNEDRAGEEVEVVNQIIELGEPAPESETIEQDIEDGNVEEAGEGPISFCSLDGSVEVANPVLSSRPELQDIVNEVPIEEKGDTIAEEVAQPGEQLEEEETSQKQSPVSTESSTHIKNDANQATATLPNISAAKYLRTELPALLPDDFLTDEDATAVAKQTAPMVAKKTKFADVPEVPKTRRIGTTAYKVEKVENPLLAPKSKTAARSTKESWIQHGRSGAKTNPNRKPFSKGFFVSKK